MTASRQSRNGAGAGAGLSLNDSRFEFLDSNVDEKQLKFYRVREDLGP